MSVASAGAGEDFRVGEVLSRAWRIFAGSIVFFLGVTILIYVVVFAAAFGFSLGFIFLGRAVQSVGLIGLGGFVAVLLAIGLNMVGQAVLLVGAFQRLRGEPIQAGAALRRALARFFPLLGLIVVWGLSILVVAGVGAALAAGLIRAAGPGWAVLTPVLFVPFVIVLIMWAVVVPVCVVEDLGPIASMRRSASLTKGHRWKIFGIILLLSVVSVVGNVVLQALLRLASPVLAGVGGLAWLAAWTAYWNCAIIMMYHDLRVAKEGVDTEQIAAIFD